jgi:hypothetical protein
MKSTRTVRSITIFGVVMVLAILTVAGTVWACGVRSPGYWKTHPEAWPVGHLHIAQDPSDPSSPSRTYSEAEVLDALLTPVKGDKSYTLFSAVAAALLNGYNGAPMDASTLATRNAAIAWCYAHPPGSGVEASSDAWKYAEPLYYTLDAYNNGLLGVPAED